MDLQVWHDESARFQKTGRLDQGPCWCPDCLDGEGDDETPDN
jgi:hypothetical protein